MDGRRVVKMLAVGLFRPLSPVFRALGLNAKGWYELAYWKSARSREGVLQNAFYEALFTTDIGLDRAFYTGKKVLDVGCGPRGSLEWADMAAERVGLDPLVDSYRALGIDKHKMCYVNAPAEQIPFPDGYFDVVTSINSLDHVDVLDSAIKEIIRVLAPGGQVVLMVEIHRKPTIAEPIILSWDVMHKFQPALRVLEEQHYELNPNARGVAAGVKAKIPFDHGDASARDGVLYARLVKNASA